MSLVNIAYVLLFIGITLKTLGLYFLANKKAEFEIRKKKYMYLNIPSYFFLLGGVLILVYEWYL